MFILIERIVLGPFIFTLLYGEYLISVARPTRRYRVLFHVNVKWKNYKLNFFPSPGYFYKKGLPFARIRIRTRNFLCYFGYARKNMLKKPTKVEKSNVVAAEGRRGVEMV